MSQAPLDAFQPPGDRLVISPGVYIRTTLVPWRWDMGDNRKVCPTSKQGGIRLEGIWFSKSEIKGNTLTLSCSFLPRAWKIFTRGKTWPELCI